MYNGMEAFLLVDRNLGCSPTHGDFTIQTTFSSSASCMRTEKLHILCDENKVLMIMKFQCEYF